MPPAAGSRGSEAVALARIVGLELSPWQELFLEDAMATRPDGRWAAKEVGLNVPRQNGKGNILAARQLWGLLLGGEMLIVHTAHQFDTAQEHFGRLVTLFETCDFLAEKLKRIRTANGSEGIELLNGARLNVKARSKGKGRGFSGDSVFFDEAMILGEGTLDGLLPTMATRDNPQAWYSGSAPVIGSESDIWRGIITDGRRPGNPMAYSEWSCPVGADLSDPANLVASNPGMPVTVSAEFVEQVERPRLTEDGLGRERFGIWNPEEALPSFIPANLWDECADPMARPGDPVVFGVEMTLDRLSASIGVAGPTDDGYALGLAGHVTGPDTAAWIVRKCVELNEAHSPRFFAVDEMSAVATLVPELESAGVTVRQYRFADMKAACAGLFDDVMTGTLRHNGDQVLAGAVAGAKKRDAGGAWLWDRKPGQVITPLVAVTLARHGHLQDDVPETVAIGAVYI